MPAISPSRKAAFRILLSVEREQSYADDLLREKTIDALSPADRNLTTALVLGVLRWQIWLDHQLRPLLNKPGAKLDIEILIALRLGAFQLLRLDRVPAHAAIDESVEMAKQAGRRFASGMVNAVLRKIAKAAGPAPTIEIIEVSAAGDKAKPKSAAAKGKQKAQADTRQKPSEAVAAAEESAEQIAIRELALEQGHPAWMVERWVANYGMEAARAICIHGQTQPALSVRVGGTAVVNELRQAGIVLEQSTLLAAVRTLISGDVRSSAVFVEGRARIQDEGSQLVGELAAGAGREVKDILDLCAAPGGKTLILAERNRLARIVACESSPARFAAMSERLAAYADRIECRLADATVLEEDSAFDVVLADVPCSGTGTLGRNPEIRHRLRVEDLVHHAERQRAILRAAIRAVRPGGSVVYSTCSLEPEENEQVVAAVLAEMPDARQVSLAGRIEGLRSAGILKADSAERLVAGLTAEDALQLLPGAFPTDGFFIALIEKGS